MGDRCRWRYDREVGRYWLPGCMGGAVYGESGCTCPTGPSRAELEDRVEKLEAEVTQLRAATVTKGTENG